MQISQPRTPCNNLARKWKTKRLPALADQSGRTGWYLRVLKEGHVEAGLPVVLVERPFPEWTVRRTYRVAHDEADRKGALELARLAPLSEGWRAALAQRAAK